MKHRNKDRDPQRTLSRREFLRGSAAAGALAAAAGGVLAGCGSAPTQPTPPQDQDESRAFDFVNLYRHVGDIDTGPEALDGLAVDAQDRIAAAAAGGIVLYSPQGVELRRWPTDPPARCVAVGADGSVWAAARDQVWHFADDGRKLGGFSAAGNGARREPMIVSIAVWESSVLMADVTNRRVRRFAANGDFINDIGESDGGLVIPSPYMTVCVDAAGVVCFGHTGGRRVDRYQLDGTMLDHWGERGMAVGQFSGCCNPVGLCVTKDGRTVTAEKGLGRVTVFDKDHKPISLVGPKQFSRESSAIAVAEDSAGRILVADTAAKRIRIYRRA